ncbi:MAG: hypothetical protein JJT81_09890, partial [Rubellimicrobium sp.]|nr:hypothetical protein [Rubellimicrobium sp.]
MAFPAIDPGTLFEAHSGFFDLDHVRESVPALAGSDQGELIRALLDPDQALPPAPNRIFDPHFYMLQRARTGLAGPVNPILHYLAIGAVEGLGINLLFDRAFYARNARLRDASPLGPVLHALAQFDRGLTGFSPFVDVDFISARTGRAPSPAFLRDLFAGTIQPDQLHPLVDLGHMRAQVARPLDTVRDVLWHYWFGGQDLSPHPLFNLAHYRSQVPGGADLAHSAYHYLTSAAPLSPHPLFDPEFYADRVRCVTGRAPADPLAHYLTTGDAMGLAPSPWFDTAFYRSRSGCVGNALRHYLAGGHRLVPPHPMIDAWAAQMFAASRPVTCETLAELLATRPDEVPLSLTPDFSSDHYRKLLQDPPDTAPALRDRYVRQGYPAGVRPNGLVSVPYLTARCRMLGLDALNPIAACFELGWHRRRRILVALPSMEESAVNRALLGLCAAQLGHPELEIVVVAQEPGPMSAAFFEVAHVWHLAAHEAPALDKALIRLDRTLAANPPAITLVDCGQGIALARAMARSATTLAVFGDGGLSQLSPDEAAELSVFADLVLCDSDELAISLVRTGERAGPVAGSRAKVAPGLFMGQDVAPPSAAARGQAREALGLARDEVLIVASGTGSLVDGTDRFGALAALCGDRGDGIFERAVFLWHGPGKVLPDTPPFYAAHFARLGLGGGGRFRQVHTPGLETVLAAADIYVSLGHEPGHDRDGAGSRAARAAGVPVLAMGEAAIPATPAGDGVLTVGRFDLGAARDALRDLVADPAARARLAEEARSAGAGRTGLAGLVARMETAFAGLVPEIGLIAPASSGEGRMLVILPDRSLVEALVVRATRAEVRDGAQLLWFDLSHGALPDA